MAALGTLLSPVALPPGPAPLPPEIPLPAAPAAPPPRSEPKPATPEPPDKIAIAGQGPPHAQDQSNEHLPWPRLLKYAALALGLFAAAGIAAVLVQRDELGSLSDDRTIATKRVDATQLGIVEPRLIETETRAQQQRALRKAQLEDYGWVDREKNVIRLPITRGMQLVVEGRR